MAYFFIEDPLHQPTGSTTRTVVADTDQPRLTPLEWSVVALARGDPLSSLGKPGRIAVAMCGLFGTRHNPRFACPRLEALRRVAVFAWRRIDALPDSEASMFIEAGKIGRASCRERV